ncbi:LPP20 family lipoprotein [Rheinheimera gaetbuli]
MKVLYSLIIIHVLLISGCSLIADRHIEYASVKPDTFPVVRAVGYAPISSQLGDNAEHKMLQAMKASKLDAYRELAELVHGQKIDAKTELSVMTLTDERLSASVRGVIQGARVIKTYAVDDIYITELELDFKQLYNLDQNIRPKQTIKSVKYYY